MSIFRRIFNTDGHNKPESEAGKKLTVITPEPVTAVWTVGGGKGGVGKSFIAANLAVTLARLNKKVLVVDADLGAANMHTFLGTEGSKRSLSSFLKSDQLGLEPYIKETGIANLDLVSGANDSLDVADLKGDSITRLQEAIYDLDYEVVVLDIGPGTSSNMLDLFLMADEGVLVTTPEPTSIENTYRYLKCLLLRRIRNIVRSRENTRLKELLEKTFASGWSSRIKTVSDILMYVRRLDPDHGNLLNEFMGHTGLSMVINQTQRHEDGSIGPTMERACKGYFGIEIDHLADIPFEDVVPDSIRSRRPVAAHYSGSSAAMAIDKCVQALLARMPNQDRQQSFSN